MRISHKIMIHQLFTRVLRVKFNKFQNLCSIIKIVMQKFEIIIDYFLFSGLINGSASIPELTATACSLP